jgi:hypothetical protein
MNRSAHRRSVLGEVKEREAGQGYNEENEPNALWSWSFAKEETTRIEHLLAAFPADLGAGKQTAVVVVVIVVGRRKLLISSSTISESFCIQVEIVVAVGGPKDSIEIRYITVG